jgi:Tol biopolymer transport system component
MRCSRYRLISHILLFVAALIALVSTAHATFPGKNGRIAFVQAGEIFTMKPDGSDVKQLTHVGPDRAASWPAWSADGKQIVFNEGPADAGGTGEIWSMNSDGSNQRQVLAESGFSENRPSFSPDGTKIVFGRCDLNLSEGDSCGIFTVGVDGRQLKTVVPIRLGDTDRSPMFSPDGTTIAFIISPDEHGGFNGVTYLVDADGSDRRRITPPGPCLIRPDWSPDGREITLFAHLCNPQNENIAVMNADGSNVHYLTHNGTNFFNAPHDRNPAFSPDGRFIVFERNAPDFSSSAIYIMKSDGSQTKAIAQLPRAPQPRSSRGKGKLRKIEEGGNTPRWGVASE